MSADAYWTLADLIESYIEDAQDEPHYSTREHALMAAGDLSRGWLAEHDRQVKARSVGRVRVNGLLQQLV